MLVALLLSVWVGTSLRAATNDLDPGVPTFDPYPQPIILIETDASGPVQSSTWIGSFVAGTNYRVSFTDDGYAAILQWKVRHDWLEREVMRERQKNFHLSSIIEIDRKQIKSLKWDALGGKIVIVGVVLAAVFGGTVAIVNQLK